MLDTIPAAPAGDFIAPEETPRGVRHRPEFHGRTGEYFGIWIVNILLSIVTLGIYSAWAKVRTERYFYGNTALAGSTFDYVANPISILKGRLIAYAVLITLVVSSKFAPMLYLLLFFSIALMVPALIVWSLRFRARNSVWRGLSFRFDESAGAAYGPFMGWAWLSGLTLSLLYPVMKMRQHEFVVEGHRYGRKRFSYHGHTGDYYLPYGIAAVLSIGLMAALAYSFSTVAGSADAVGNEAGVRAILTVMAFYLAFFVVMIFLRVRYTNLLWNSARIGPHRFESNLRARDMFWIYASNALVVICTVGLAMPWAMIRLARYRAAHFSIVAIGSIEEFFAASESSAGATGAELVDALDVGMDFGL